MATEDSHLRDALEAIANYFIEVEVEGVSRLNRSTQFNLLTWLTGGVAVRCLSRLFDPNTNIQEKSYLKKKHGETTEDTNNYKNTCFTLQTHCNLQ